MRLGVPLFSQAVVYTSPLLLCLSFLGFVLGSLTTLRQVDLKKIVAYSSVAHMSVVTLILFTAALLTGALFMMIAHGLVSPALFVLVGLLYERWLKWQPIVHVAGDLSVAPFADRFASRTTQTAGFWPMPPLRCGLVIAPLRFASLRPRYLRCGAAPQARCARLGRRCLRFASAQLRPASR